MIPRDPRHASAIVEHLEAYFSDWWGAFLLYTLEALKVFRVWGDDDKQLLMWALTAKALERRATGITLSEVATMSGVPIETARRNLVQLTEQGNCIREGDLYRAVVSQVVTVELEQLARRFAKALAVNVPQAQANSTDVDLAAYLRASLNYASNIRRYVARGAYVASVVAGMVEIESHVRFHLLRHGLRSASRSEYNQIVEEFPDNKFHATRISQLTGEAMDKVRNAIRYAEGLGVVTLFGHDLCAFNAKAAWVPGDRQAYTRGVKEELAEFILSTSPEDVALSA